MPPVSKEQLQQYRPYLYIALGILVVFILLGQLVPIRVGDGSEYYAMYVAWDVTFRPWMTPFAYEAYDQLVSSNHVTGLVSGEWLDTTFAFLKTGDTGDYNHFWFYSLLAVIFSRVLGIVGLDLQPHAGFLAVHYALLTLPALLAYHHFKWRGVAAVLVMTFLSPVLWFLDKVHTEFFTYCLVLSAIISIYARKHLPGSLFLAIASTQNPSFAVLALVPMLYRVVLQWKEKYSFTEVCYIVAAALLVLMHPVYYFLRLGVVTPQLLYGASFGEYLSYFYIWLIDPDLGLFPNWPLGALIAIVALVIYVRKRKRGHTVSNFPYIGFVVIYLTINLVAHSSTINLNSGATPGIARYALWYLPLLFPVLYWLLTFTHVSRKVAYTYGSIAIILSLITIAGNHPRKNEGHIKPTRLSYFIQSSIPWFYSPPAEVFIERYSGHGEDVYRRLYRGVLGPDCRKMAIPAGYDRHGVTGAGDCGFNDHMLDDFITSKTGAGVDKPVYLEISKEDIPKLMYIVPRGVNQVGIGHAGNNILGAGWSVPEEKGIWSEQGIPGLQVPCGNEQFYAGNKDLTISFVVSPFTTQKVRITNTDNSVVYWEGEINEPLTTVTFNVPADNCRDNISKLLLHISNPVSPSELGKWVDLRKLGLFFFAFEVKQAL